MDTSKRALLEPVFNSLLQEKEVDLLPFPDEGDEGGGNGEDKHLAQIILYGAGKEIDEDFLEFAIKLGRALQEKGL